MPVYTGWPASQQTAAGSATHRIGDMALREASAFARKPIENWRPADWIPVTGERIGAQLIRHEEDQIRPALETVCRGNVYWSISAGNTPGKGRAGSPAEETAAGKIFHLQRIYPFNRAISFSFKVMPNPGRLEGARKPLFSSSAGFTRSALHSTPPNENSRMRKIRRRNADVATAMLPTGPCGATGI